MARRKTEASPIVPGMPEELRRRPSSDEAIAFWVGDDVMPTWWAIGGEAQWRAIHARSEWSHARQAWRAANDPTCWWYGRDQRGNAAA